jgi:hypothetical protein
VTVAARGRFAAAGQGVQRGGVLFAPRLGGLGVCEAFAEGGTIGGRSPQPSGGVGQVLRVLLTLGVDVLQLRGELGNGGFLGEQLLEDGLLGPCLQLGSGELGGCQDGLV